MLVGCWPSASLLPMLKTTHARVSAQMHAAPTLHEHLCNVLGGPLNTCHRVVVMMMVQAQLPAHQSSIVEHPSSHRVSPRSHQCSTCCPIPCGATSPPTWWCDPVQHSTQSMHHAHRLARDLQPAALVCIYRQHTRHLQQVRQAWRPWSDGGAFWAGKTRVCSLGIPSYVSCGCILASDRCQPSAHPLPGSTVHSMMNM